MFCELCLTNENSKKICYKCCNNLTTPKDFKKIIKKEDFILKVENKNN